MQYYPFSHSIFDTTVDIKYVKTLTFILICVIIYKNFRREALDFSFAENILLNLKGFFTKNRNDGEISLESIIGSRCVVIDKVNTFAGSGIVKVNGTMWAARGAFDDDVFEVGESLRVVAIEGVKLICKKN